MVSAAALLLADGRFPAGGHAHSGGLEAAVTAGTVHDLPSLDRFLRGRLRTAGLVAAGLAAAACATATSPTASADPTATSPTAPAGPTARWLALDAEADARTPSPAQRAASRRQGRALLRTARTAWSRAAYLSELGPAPHHAIALGAAAAAAGCESAQAALIAAYQSVTGPASAAIRLLSLDPLAVNALLAALAPDIDAVATAASSSTELPCSSGPALDLLAEVHVRTEMRLFAS
jgi:urease accessory protein